MNKDQFKTEIMPILILTIIVCVAVVALTVVNDYTSEKIEENAEQKTLDNLSIIFPEMDAFELDDNSSVYTILKGNDTLGYAFEAVGPGYGGDITIMVGIDNITAEDGNVTEANVIAISIVSAKDETPGLGQKITEDMFKNRFINATVYIDGSIKNADGEEVDTISGATISTSAVIETVIDATMEKAQLIHEKQIQEVA